MTTAEKEPLTDLIDEYSTWLERRQELSTIEERDGHVPPSRWHESDDQAVFLLHRLADSARGKIGQYYVQITETARYGLTVLASNRGEAERRAEERYCDMGDERDRNHFEAVIERECVARPKPLTTEDVESERLPEMA